jgi:hypothetical protein
MAEMPPGDQGRLEEVSSLALPQWLLGEVRMNVRVLVLRSTSAHEYRSTGTREYYYARMQEYWYSGGSTDTLYLFLTYVEVDLLFWGGQRHPDSRGNSLLSLLENNHRNKAFLNQTGVIIRMNTIGALLQHYSVEVHPFIPHNEWSGRKRPRWTWRLRRQGTRRRQR